MGGVRSWNLELEGCELYIHSKSILPENLPFPVMIWNYWIGQRFRHYLAHLCVCLVASVLYMQHYAYPKIWCIYSTVGISLCCWMHWI